MTFETLTFDRRIIKNLTREGYENATEIQEKAIPIIREGHDLMASAQTGTGKTAAFALPIIESIAKKHMSNQKKRPIQAVILAPTRELAQQITQSFLDYSQNTGLRVRAIYGGVSKRNQIMALKKGVDVLVATPGRLLDLMNMRLIDLKAIEFFVLDEADRMLDMGFIDDVKTIYSKVETECQTLLFSATISKEVEKLAKVMLKDPMRLDTAPKEEPLRTIKQSLFRCDERHKNRLLFTFIHENKPQSALIFTRTKQRADSLFKKLFMELGTVGIIHGDKTQRDRLNTLNAFKRGEITILVATDVVARGIDIHELEYVINYDMPDQVESYIHRIGRTGRNHKHGEAVSFVSPKDRGVIKEIESLYGRIFHDRSEQTSDKPVKNKVKKPFTNNNKSTKQDSKPYNKKKKAYSKDKNTASGDAKPYSKRKKASNTEAKPYNNDEKRSNNDAKPFNRKGKTQKPKARKNKSKKPFYASYNKNKN